MQNRLRDGIAYVEDYALSLGDDSTTYWKYHKQRFEWTARLILDLAARLNGAGTPMRKMLDVGPAHQTLLLEQLFPDAQIDTLGFLDQRYALKRQTVHIHFDLNDTFDREKWPIPDGEKYDIIVLLEVIEHLYTSPRLIFAYLKEILQPHGLIVTQTPNAVSLGRRIKVLAGRNPYDLIRESRTNPGHFREYTSKEMCQLAEAAGLALVEAHTINYFNNKGLPSRISGFLPASFRDGMTHVFGSNAGST